MMMPRVVNCLGNGKGKGIKLNGNRQVLGGRVQTPFLSVGVQPLGTGKAVAVRLGGARWFATDEGGFHDDFKSIRKKYEKTPGMEGEDIVDVQAFIKGQVESHPLVLFMKGVPEAPQCGFSNLVCRILKEEGVTKIHAINVLADDGVRQGIKEFSQWPTIPQLFINHEFVGGSDIVKSMFESGELKKALDEAKVPRG